VQFELPDQTRDSLNADPPWGGLQDFAFPAALTTTSTQACESMH
jgi:hypothetical protein